MNTHLNGVELGIVIGFFVLVAVVGFLAARWQRGPTLLHLDEWGLGGRRFGGFITWFLLGGDLYTAYTFVAVPALLFSAGAMGFFAVPYTILVWPLVFVFLPRLWSVSHRHGFVTPADFVRGRYDSKGLGLAVALTGIIATMPYVALQLVGIQACLDVIGIGTGAHDSWVAKDLPLFIAFAVLAAYTYSSGLRAPALIAFVKDFLIYLVVIVAVVWVPHAVGGWSHIFSAADHTLAQPSPTTHKAAGSILVGSGGSLAYMTLAIGSALALFAYPHAQVGVLATKSRNTVRRNTAALTVYSLLLGVIALLGYMAIAKGLTTKSLGGNAQHAVPALFNTVFPSWFAGVAFAAITIGALVPAAIMSIAAANLFTRNVYRAYLRPQAGPAEETRVAKVVSLLVKLGALVFVLSLDRTAAINFQLLGGVWILQTFPAVVVGLFTRFFHRWALLVGWAAGMSYGTLVAYDQSSPTQAHFAAQVARIPFTHTTAYIGISALVLNVVVATVLTLAFRLLRVPAGQDATVPADYRADAPAADVPVPGGDVEPAPGDTPPPPADPLRPTPA